MKECFKSTKCTLESSSFSDCKFYGSEFWCSVDSPNLLKEVCRDGREEKAFSKKQLFLALDWSQWLLFICVVSQHADPHYKCNGLTEHNWQMKKIKDLKFPSVLTWTSCKRRRSLETIWWDSIPKFSTVSELEMKGGGRECSYLSSSKNILFLLGLHLSMWMTINHKQVNTASWRPVRPI